MPRATSALCTLLVNNDSHFRLKFKSTHYLCIYRCINWSKNKTPEFTVLGHLSNQSKSYCNNKTQIHSHSLESGLPVLGESLCPSRGEFPILKFITNCCLHKPTTVQNSNESIGDKLICACVRSVSLSLSELLTCARQAAFQGIPQSTWESDSLLYFSQLEDPLFTCWDFKKQYLFENLSESGSSWNWNFFVRWEHRLSLRFLRTSLQKNFYLPQSLDYALNFLTCGTLETSRAIFHD